MAGWEEKVGNTSSGWATCLGRAGPARPAARLLARACCCRASARASSRWRPGSTRPGSGRRTSPCTASSQGPLGRRRPVGGGAGLRAAGDAGARSGPGLARGRHRPAEEGQALGRGGAAVLRPARQAGELPGRAVTLSVATEARQPAHRLPALPARGLGRRPGAAGVGGGAGGGRVRDQAGDRARPGPAGVGRRCPAGGSGDRRRVRQRHRLPRRRQGAGPPYVAGILGTTGLWPPGAGPLPPARWSGTGRPPKRLRRDPEHQPLAARRLAAGLPAGAWRTVTWREGTAGSAGLALRGRAGPPGARRLPAERAAPGGVAPGRVARGGGASPRSTGSRPCPRPPRSRRSPPERSCARASSATSRSLSRNSGWGTSRAAAGAASTTTPALCVAAYGFLAAERCRFCPLRAGDPDSARSPSGRPATAPATPPVRPERHSPASIATLRRHLAVALMRRLPRCPCCLRSLRAAARSPVVHDTVVFRLLSGFGVVSIDLRD